ncbi:MAG: hypothetical protein V4525_07030 [Pseudomonadota bacterium]
MNQNSHEDNTFPTPDEISFYRLYRDLVNSEDALISNRMSWFLSTQTMLFILWTSLAKPIAPFYAAGICTFGMLFCIPTFIGVWSAQLAVKDALKRYKENLPGRHHPRLPDMTGKLNYNTLGNSTPHLVNLLCFCGWTLVLKLWA